MPLVARDPLAPCRRIRAMEGTADGERPEPAVPRNEGVHSRRHLELLPDLVDDALWSIA